MVIVKKIDKYILYTYIIYLWYINHMSIMDINKNTIIKAINEIPTYIHKSQYPIVIIQIQNYELPVFIDTGADRSYITSKTKSIYKLNNTNNIDFKLYNINYNISFKCVMSDDNIVVLGINFLKKYLINMDFGNNVIFSKHFVEPLKYCYIDDVDDFFKKYILSQKNNISNLNNDVNNDDNNNDKLLLFSNNINHDIANHIENFILKNDIDMIEKLFNEVNDLIFSNKISRSTVKKIITPYKYTLFTNYCKALLILDLECINKHSTKYLNKFIIINVKLCNNNYRALIDTCGSSCVIKHSIVLKHKLNNLIDLNSASSVDFIDAKINTPANISYCKLNIGSHYIECLFNTISTTRNTEYDIIFSTFFLIDNAVIIDFNKKQLYFSKQNFTVDFL